MPSPELLVESLVDGLFQGMIYALAAIGLTLIFGVMNVINLAHGAFVTAGMFGVFVVATDAGLHPYLAFVVAALAGFLLGLIVYWIAVHRLQGKPELTTLLSTFAVGIMLVGLGTSVFSTTPRNIAVNLGATNVGPIRLLNTSLAAAAIALALVAALYYFLGQTRSGKMIRAVADNRSAAELVGIPSSRVLARAFALGTLLAVAAGGLIATLFPFTVLSGAAYELKSFVIVVLGGMGNVRGALLGGLVLGAIEGIVPVVMSAGWTPVIEFVIFVLVLVVRPQGLLGTAR